MVTVLLLLSWPVIVNHPFYVPHRSSNSLLCISFVYYPTKQRKKNGYVTSTGILNEGSWPPATDTKLQNYKITFHHFNKTQRKCSLANHTFNSGHLITTEDFEIIRMVISSGTLNSWRELKKEFKTDELTPRSNFTHIPFKVNLNTSNRHRQHILQSAPRCRQLGAQFAKVEKRFTPYDFPIIWMMHIFGVNLFLDWLKHN